MRSACLAAFLLVSASVSAQTGVGFDFNVAPAVTWTEDVSAFTFDPNDPSTILDRDSLDLPVTVGIQGGLGLTVYRGPIGVRLGGQFLNTTALYDGEQTLNRAAFETNFVTVQLDLQYARNLGPASAYVFGGPEARYLLDLSGEIAGVQDVRDGLDLLSVAANLGAGLRFDVGGTRFGPEVRYALDLTGVGGEDIELDNGNTLRFDEAFDVNTLLVGFVFGGR
ncbi:MAG: hypothetical protein AAF845_16925 [Bacteroidota bacterium]